jgi:alpha-galactosidase
VTLVGLEWSTDTAGVGLPVDRLVHDGYQSWTYTGVESIPGSLMDTGGTAPHGGDDENVLGEIPGVSWWWAAASDASGHGLVAGADGGTVLKTYVALDGTSSVRMRIVEGVTGDAILLQPGQAKTLDGLYLALGDVGPGLDAYTRYVASKHPATAPRRPPMGGWGSWNTYYDSITASALAQEQQWASTSLLPVALGDFLLDDGYETHWGSWTASASFGASLQSVAASESAAGLRPAVWIAPFYVDTTDPNVTAHPDWFVHGLDGSIRTYDNYGPKSAALDVTNPAARAFVVQAVQQYAAWGFQTLKIDFLFGGALEGIRPQPLTSLESYALWMKTLRDALPGVRLVGCGAPMLPSVGWVDAMRVGPDIAYVTNPAPNYTFLSAEARHVAMRAPTDAWWALDPDVVLLRGSAITDDEAWTVVVFSALAGGDYVLGDGHQAGATRESYAVARDVLAITRDGIAARPVDLTASIDPKLFPSPLLAGTEATMVPHVWKKTSADGLHGWLAVFGWEVDGYSASVDLPQSADEIIPPAAGQQATRQPFGGSRTVTVKQHGVRLFGW